MLKGEPLQLLAAYLLKVPTITGGCLNPSKSRFLHPKEHRCITAREAAILETYKFPPNIPRGVIALIIDNALPPEFYKQQA